MQALIDVLTMKSLMNEIKLRVKLLVMEILVSKKNKTLGIWVYEYLHVTLFHNSKQW